MAASIHIRVNYTHIFYKCITGNKQPDSRSKKNIKQFQSLDLVKKLSNPIVNQTTGEPEMSEQTMQSRVSIFAWIKEIIPASSNLSPN